MHDSNFKNAKNILLKIEQVNITSKETKARIVKLNNLLANLKQFYWFSYNIYAANKPVFLPILGQAIAQSTITEFTCLDPDFDLLFPYLAKSKFKILTVGASQKGRFEAKKFTFDLTNIESLTLVDMEGTPEEWIAIIEKLPNSLTQFSFSGNYNDAVIDAIVKKLPDMKQLSEISIGGYGSRPAEFSPNKLQNLIETLKELKLTKLTLANLNAHSLSKGVFDAVAEILCQIPIKHFAMMKTYFKSEAMYDFIKKLPNTQLTTLTLNVPNMKFKIFEPLAKVIKKTLLQEIVLPENICNDKEFLKPNVFIGSHISIIEPSHHTSIVENANRNVDYHHNVSHQVEDCLKPHLVNDVLAIIHSYRTNNPCLIPVAPSSKQPVEIVNDNYAKHYVNNKKRKKK